ncbi:MAG: TetR/AcrR family transcriptional regulator [Nocardioides sp.]
MTQGRSAPRRGRPPIPRERIVAVALEIVAQEGADALSLRNLAARLSSSTSTLYRHVDNRRELIALVFDGLLGEVPLDGGTAHPQWGEECRAVASKLFSVLSAHRGAAGLVGETVPSGPNALAIREYLFGVLTGAGFPLGISAKAVATLGHYVIGFAMQAPANSPAHPSENRLGDIDSEKYPLTAEALPRLPIPLDVEFAFGLDLILNGLRRYLGD